MSTARWFRSLVTTRPDLYRAIYDWNVYPHRWALPARLEAFAAAVPAPALALLEKTPAGRARLGRHTRRSLGLEEMFWDFESASRRLALLPASALARLAHTAGAALHWPRLARIVAKAERRALTEGIGESAYVFAMRRGRLLVAPAGLVPAEDPAPPLAEAIPVAGWRALAAVLGAEPAALQSRFLLKTPPGLEFSPPEIDADAAWAFLEPIARETLTAEERRCFA